MPKVVQKLEDFVNLSDPDKNQIFNMTLQEAEELVSAGKPEEIRKIDGNFAIVTKRGKQVYMARSIGRPLRYFMAKQVAGPLLIVADRIDDIYQYLKTLGLHHQFRPDYTRMVPAHYVTRLDVIGCPDPNPDHKRFFTPEMNRLDPDLDKIGEAYISAMADECSKWLDSIPKDEPVGVLFSGGIDSGSVFLVLYDLLLRRGESPSRLKAFTLSVNRGSDADQAHRFLDSLGLGMFLEVVEGSPEDLDYKETIRIIEDYKQRDVEAATVTLALCRKIRERYPNWKYLVDGDGGDENLKAYPIEENPELTIRSVLGNPLLYHEGWGVDKMKHSLTYSGGQSRGHVRTYATANRYEFQGFSPYTLPNVIEISEGIPFVRLTNWKHEELYALKGEVVRRGVRAVTGLDMPVYQKRRMQHGTVGGQLFDKVFPKDESVYRNFYKSLYR